MMIDAQAVLICGTATLAGICGLVILVGLLQMSSRADRDADRIHSNMRGDDDEK